MFTFTYQEIKVILNFFENNNNECFRSELERHRNRRYKCK